MDLYQPGLKVLPGSAMPRTKHSLGFLAVRVQLLLSPGPVYGLYLEGEPPLKMLRKIASYSHEEVGAYANRMRVFTVFGTFNRLAFFPHL